MSGGGLPPPPTRADTGDFAWVAWYNQLYSLLSTTGAVSWDQINKAGSSIADLQNHNHGLLAGLLGTGEYHVTSTQAANLTSGVSGTFTAGIKTITVTNGIITAIV
jgi:hypothetical protein